MRDTNRVAHVTLRFFLLRVSFATLKLSDRQNEKRKDNETWKKKEKGYYG